MMPLHYPLSTIHYPLSSANCHPSTNCFTSFFGGQKRTKKAHKRRKIQHRRLIRRDVALVLLLTVQWNIVVSAECWDDELCK
jgi:hypothetical protein